MLVKSKIYYDETAPQLCAGSFTYYTIFLIKSMSICYI